MNGSPCKGDNGYRVAWLNGKHDRCRRDRFSRDCNGQSGGGHTFYAGLPIVCLPRYATLENGYKTAGYENNLPIGQFFPRTKSCKLSSIWIAYKNNYLGQKGVLYPISTVFPSFPTYLPAGEVWCDRLPLFFLPGNFYAALFKFPSISLCTATFKGNNLHASITSKETRGGPLFKSLPVNTRHQWEQMIFEDSCPYATLASSFVRPFVYCVRRVYAYLWSFLARN